MKHRFSHSQKVVMNSPRLVSLNKKIQLREDMVEDLFSDECSS
jgi:hypothetical protein